MDAQQQVANPLHTMDDDQLLSAMTLADRAELYEDFVKYRRELMYRLRCSRPLVNWVPPTRLEKE